MQISSLIDLDTPQRVRSRSRSRDRIDLRDFEPTFREPKSFSSYDELQPEMPKTKLKTSKSKVGFSSKVNKQDLSKVIVIDDDPEPKISFPSSEDSKIASSSFREDPRRRFLKSQKKYNLVLDLDETLINSNCKEDDQPRIREAFADKIQILDEKSSFVTRKHLKEFLETMDQHYNLFMYSHGGAAYVQQVLSKIDPKKLINRQRIFLRDESTFKPGQKKNLANLNFTEDEMENTLILDDQPGVWDPSQQHLVLPSKRFCPLNSSNDQKYRYFDIGYIEGSAFFSENFEGDQLKNLARQLADFARFSSSRGSISKVLDNSILKPLRGKKMRIGALTKNMERILEDIVVRIGGELSYDNPEILVVPFNQLDEEKMKKVQEWLDENSLRETKDVSWLLESFFSLDGRLI